MAWLTWVIMEGTERRKPSPKRMAPNHHVDFTSDYGCAVPQNNDAVMPSPPNYPKSTVAPLRYPRTSQWQVNNAYSKFFKQGSAGDANHQQTRQCAGT